MNNTVDNDAMSRISPTEFNCSSVIIDWTELRVAPDKAVGRKVGRYVVQKLCVRL